MTDFLLKKNEKRFFHSYQKITQNLQCKCTLAWHRTDKQLQVSLPKLSDFQFK